MSIQKSINEVERRTDFENFSWRMSLRWNFRAEDSSEDFSYKPMFCPKSNWNWPTGHPG